MRATTMLDSPIKSVGGKSKLRSEVIARLPQGMECWVEVFCGASWCTFAKQPHPVEVLNDANSDLVNLWRVLKWRPAELLEEIQQHLYSREMFYELRETNPINEMDKAVRTYLLIQQSFGSDISRNPSWGFRNRSPRDLFLNKSLEQIFPASVRLRNVFIEHSDFAKVIELYDQPNTIFFCDPPYLDQSGYAVEFEQADHCRLRASLGAIEGKFLLTVNDHPFLRELYEGFVIAEETEARCVTPHKTEGGRVAAPILFISNYTPKDGGLFAE